MQSKKIGLNEVKREKMSGTMSYYGTVTKGQIVL